jgi:FtsH-binding integral membrane protein
MGYPTPTYQNEEVQREIQRGFLRKVYGILCLQLLCTVGMCWAVMAHPGS